MNPLRVLMAVTLLALSAHLPAEETAPLDLPQVEKRIQALQPKPEERRFDQIAWAGNISEALRFAREQHRAVFYFTHDGRMASGRC